MRLLIQTSKNSFLLACLALLFACHATQQNPKLNFSSSIPASFIPPPPLKDTLEDDIEASKVITINDALTLNLEQKASFIAYFNSLENEHIEAHKRLFYFLEQLLTSFEYRPVTLSAEKTWELQQGNCMSLAILTTALAKLVDLEIDYQMVISPPTYQRHNGVLALSTHVRSIIYKPRPNKSELEHKKKHENTLLLSPGYVVIDYFPLNSDIRGGNVNEHDFYAMYYRNIAAEAMFNGQFLHAKQLLHRALEVAPQNTESLNALAVVNLRLGDEKQALALFEYAMRYAESSLLLIDNYANILESKGRIEEAQAMRQEIINSDDDNPFTWIDKANELLSEKNLFLAEKYFVKATKIAPYVHQSYLGLARVALARKQENQALQFMKKANELAQYTPDQYTYLAKLKSLKSKI